MRMLKLYHLFISNLLKIKLDTLKKMSNQIILLFRGLIVGKKKLSYHIQTIHLIIEIDPDMMLKFPYY